MPLSTRVARARATAASPAPEIPAVATAARAVGCCLLRIEELAIVRAEVAEAALRGQQETSSFERRDERGEEVVPARILKATGSTSLDKDLLQAAH